MILRVRRTPVPVPDKNSKHPGGQHTIAFYSKYMRPAGQISVELTLPTESVNPHASRSARMKETLTKGEKIRA